MAKPDPFAPISDLGAGDAIEAWRWLIGAKPEARLLTAMGDIFIVTFEAQLDQTQVFLLDTYLGDPLLIASSWESFKERIAAPDSEVADWLKYDLLCELHEQGHALSQGECFSPKLPPIIGGSYEPDNFESVSWRVHIGIMGQIHCQVKDLPAGTPITGIDVEWQ